MLFWVWIESFAEKYDSELFLYERSLGEWVEEGRRAWPGKWKKKMKAVDSCMIHSFWR